MNAKRLVLGAVTLIFLILGYYVFIAFILLTQGFLGGGPTLLSYSAGFAVAGGWLFFYILIVGLIRVAFAKRRIDEWKKVGRLLLIVLGIIVIVSGLFIWDFYVNR